jgi:hypothetical protein
LKVPRTAAGARAVNILPARQATIGGPLGKDEGSIPVKSTSWLAADRSAFLGARGAAMVTRPKAGV